MDKLSKGEVGGRCGRMKKGSLRMHPRQQTSEEKKSAPIARKRSNRTAFFTEKKGFGKRTTPWGSWEKKQGGQPVWE